MLEQSKEAVLAQLKKAFEHSPQRILIYDAGTGKGVYANKAYFEMYPNYTLESLKKRHVLSALKPEWAITEKLTRLLEHGEPFLDLGRRKAGEGKFDFIHTAGTTFHAEGKPAFHVISSVTVPQTEIEASAFQTAEAIQQDFLSALTRSLASRHPISGAHVLRQGDLGIAAFAELAHQLNQDNEQARTLANAFRHRFPNITNPHVIQLLDERQLALVPLYALLHDLGKIGIPDRILTAKHLSPKESKIMKEGHMVETRKLVIHGVGLPEGIEPTEGLALGHHEKPSGTGYPLGKLEPDLTIGDTIGKLVDVFDVMVSKREYKKASKSPKAFLLEVARKSGHEGDFAFESARWLIDRFPKILTRYVDRVATRISETSEKIQSIKNQIDDLKREHDALLSDPKKIMARRDSIRGFRGYGHFTKAQTVAYEKRLFRARLKQFKNDLKYFQSQYDDFTKEYNVRSRWLSFKYKSFNEYRKELGLSPWFYPHERTQGWEKRGVKRRIL